MPFHYTYRITNLILNKHYYGTRTSKVIPKNDLGIKYFSSSSNKEFIQDQKENPQNYKYKVIKISNTRKQALELEIKLHNKFNVGLNENFYNRAKQTSTSFNFSWIGKTLSKEHKIKISNSSNHKGNLNPMYNKSHSEEAKKKIGLKSLGRDTNRTKNILIFNANDELIYFCDTSFITFCKNYNLPFGLLTESYKNETVLYRDISETSKKRLIKSNRLQFQGWCARLA